VQVLSFRSSLQGQAFRAELVRFLKQPLRSQFVPFVRLSAHI